MSNDPHGQTGQPLPTPNDNPSSHDLVCADLEARKQYGLNKYGSLLQAGNGRDTLRDAYEEVLDLAVYIRTLISERDATRAKLDESLAKFNEEAAINTDPFGVMKSYLADRATAVRDQLAKLRKFFP